MGEGIKPGTNKPSGWQKLARKSYRLMTEKKKSNELSKAGTSPVDREKELDEVEAQGRINRERRGSASGSQLTGGLGIGRDEDSDKRNEIAARRIIEEPFKDHLNE